MAIFLLTTEPQSSRKKPPVLMKKTTVLLFFFCCLLSNAFSQQDSAASPSFLPLLVMNFDAKVITQNVQLQWAVSNNEDVKGFEIECSVDGSPFQKIGGKLTTGKQGKVGYDFVDALPRKKASLSYRVKILAKDGTAVYSDVQSTRIEDAGLQCKLRQNPVQQTIDVEINLPTATAVQATVFTAYGQRVFSEAAKLSPGANLLSLSSQNLLPGLHRLVLESATERKVLSFVKE